MTDEQFKNELEINAFENQIDGYVFGDASRSLRFKPIVLFVKNGDGTLNRERTLDGPAYTFTDEQKMLLLDRT